jgi:phosphate transport system protein
MAHPVIDRPHTVSSYNLQLSEVSAIINRMADMARALLSGGLDALQNSDAVAAMQIVAQDKAIDALERQLERLALLTIMSRAPMAEDLRYLIAAIRIGKMLERTGDQAKRIARRLARALRRCGKWNAMPARWWPRRSRASTPPRTRLRRR